MLYPDDVPADEVAAGIVSMINLTQEPIERTLERLREPEAS